MFHNKFEDLNAEVFNLLKHNQDCIRFLSGYKNYIEAVDDLIDAENSSNTDKVTFLASQLFSSNYWVVNSERLLLVEQLIHIIYFNTVQWERSTELWKQRDAKALSHCGYYMLFAILLLETGNNLLVQEIALKYMERAHLEHMQDLTSEVANA